jgi:hypothetical protein
MSRLAAARQPTSSSVTLHEVRFALYLSGAMPVGSSSDAGGLVLPSHDASQLV